MIRRKRLAYFTIIVICTSALFCQKQFSRSSDEFAGNVKKVQKSYYLLQDKFGEIERILKKQTIYIYDIQGNRTEFTDEEKHIPGEGGFSNGSVTKYKYEYDSKNRITKLLYNGPRGEDGNTVYVIRYQYDENGKIFDETRYRENGSLEYKIIRKFSSDNTYEELYYSATGPSYQKKIMRDYYDEEGILLKTEDITNTRRPSVIYDKSYPTNVLYIFERKDEKNKAGQIVKTYYYAKSTGILKHIFIFDSNNNPIEQTDYTYIERFGGMENVATAITIWEYEYY